MQNLINIVDVVFVSAVSVGLIPALLFTVLPKTKGFMRPTSVNAVVAIVSLLAMATAVRLGLMLMAAGAMIGFVVFTVRAFLLGRRNTG